MKFKRIVLTGGSGFIGSVIANRLSRAGAEIIVPVRRRSRAQPMYLFPTATVVEADIFDPATLIQLLSGADALINLVGTLHSRSASPYGPAFQHLHVELVSRLIQACRVAGVPRMIHFSALGASPQGASEYLRSKAAGEALLHGSRDIPAWTILRPSVVFGQHDHFLNLFAQLLKWTPIVPLPAADSRLQPVHVGDVAQVTLQCLADDNAVNRTFELAGPNVYTLGQLVKYVAGLSNRKRLVFSLPDGLANLQATLAGWLPNPPITRDNLKSLKAENVADSRTPLPFDLPPTPLEAIAPAYLGRQSFKARYYRFRSRRSTD